MNGATAEIRTVVGMKPTASNGGDPSVGVRKRTELNFTPSSSIGVPLSPTDSHQNQTEFAVDSELSSSPPKKSGIPKPINGQIMQRKEHNQATASNNSNHGSNEKMQKSQVCASSAAITRNEQDAKNQEEEPLCDDILSCISALDEVIAEFDDPESLTSFPPPASPVLKSRSSQVSISAAENIPHIQTKDKNQNQTPRNAVNGSHTHNSKPAFSRLITTLSTHPQEPSVTIMQKESQTVTKIQIGSGQVSKQSPSSSTSSSATFVSSSPTSAAGAVSVVSWKHPQVTVSQNNNTTPSVANQHYSKRQQIQATPPPIKPQVVVQLKQSDFTPGVGTREPTFSTFKGSPTSTLSKHQSSPADAEKRAVFKNSFTNYELIFPKSPTPGYRANKTGQSTAVKRFPADIIINPHNYNSQNNNNFPSEAVVGAHNNPSQVSGGSSYPKIKQRQDMSSILESQADNVRQGRNNNSTAVAASFKPIQASIANNNISVVEAKVKKMLQEESLTEHWNFLSDENLPRSLRKTRRVILDEDEEGNVEMAEAKVNANQINPCTAAVRKMDANENSIGDYDTHAAASAVSDSSRSQKKQKLNHTSASESENKKLKHQQQVLKKGIDQNSPLQHQYKNVQSDASVNKNRNPSHINNKNTYSKESGHSSNRKTILTNFMFFPLSGTSSPEDELVCEQVEAAINKINNNAQQKQQQCGNLKSQINSKPTKNIVSSSGAARGPNALPPNVAQLDVDDGYLSMINRHEPPIIWPETYIESETFTPEELKKLSSVKQKPSINGRELKPNKLMSSLTTSEEKTDYFSDDSLENEQADEAENLHLSYVIATHDVNKNAYPKTGRKHHEVDNHKNVWRKSSSSSASESPIIPSSPVKKPLAFFIPLADYDPGKGKENCRKTEPNADAVVSSPNCENIVSSQGNTKHESSIVAPVVNAILENVLRVGLQEASAINFLLASADPEYDEDDRVGEFWDDHKTKASLINAKDSATGEDMTLIEPPTLPSDGSSNEIFEVNQDLPARASQYEADIEDDDEIPAREASPSKDTEKIKKKRKSKTAKNQEEWNLEMEFVEDFDQPPPFIPAPPPVSAKQLHNVPKTVEPAVVVRPNKQNEEHFDKHMTPKRASSPPCFPIATTKGSVEHLYNSGVDQKNKILFTKSYHRSVDPDVDYRVKMQRQASRSHENLLDIRSRQRDFLTPKRIHGQSCTLPPNSVPPLNQRRHSTFRQFLGGIFKRNKKAEATLAGDDSPFEDIQFSFGRKNIFPALPESSPNPTQHDLPYNERKLSFTSSPHGSQRSTRSTPVKRGLLSRIFHRKDK